MDGGGQPTDTGSILSSTLIIGFSQAALLVAGYITQVYLGRALGAAEYGAFSAALAIVTLAPFVMSEGIPKAASRFIPQEAENSYEIQQNLLAVQILLGGTATTILLMLAAPISIAIGDGSTLELILIGTWFVIPYSIYVCYLGMLNGLREFGKKSIVATTYAILKATLIVTLVMVGLSSVGAMTGLVAAGAVGAAAGIAVGGKVKPRITDRARPIVSFSMKLIAVSFTMNLVQNLDLLFVKAYSAPGSPDAGFYAVALTLARITTNVAVPFSAVVFPTVSSLAQSLSQREMAAKVGHLLGLIVGVSVPITAALVATSGDLVLLLFGAQFAPSSAILSIIAVGTLFYSLTAVLLTILNGTGQPEQSFLVGVFFLATDTLALAVLVPSDGYIGAAVATTVASIAAFVASVLMVRRRVGMSIRRNNLAIALASAVVVYSTGVPLEGTGLLKVIAVGAVCVLFVLFMKRHLSAEGDG
ncbi:MAG: oligosaccharide flippase family protein [Candidatus Thorarchaeota archaeon]